MATTGSEGRGKNRLDKRQLALAICAVLPALVPLVLILRLGTNVPYWDQWFPDLAGFQIKSGQGQLAFSDFAALHNEHRLLVPRLLYFVLGRLTDWNTVVEMVAGWAIALLTSIGVFWLIRLIAPAGKRSAGTLVVWLLCNCMIFTLAQAENWLWGIGIANLLQALFVVAALIAAIHPSLKPWPAVALIVLCCTAGTYSSGLGALAWPLSAGMIAWSRSWTEFRSRLPRLMVLAVAFALNLGCYFIGYVSPESGTTAATPATLAQRIHFFVAFVGNPFARLVEPASVGAGTVAGVILLLMFIAAAVWFFLSLRNARSAEEDWLRHRNVLVWFAIAGFGIASAALGAAARVDLGIKHAVASRYVSYSLYVPVGLTVLVWIVLADLVRRGVVRPRTSRVIAFVLAGCLVAAQVYGASHAMSYARGWQRSRKRDKASLLLLKLAPDNPGLVDLCPRPEYVASQAMALNQIGYIHPPMIESPNAALIEVPATDAFAEGKFSRFWRPDASKLSCVGWATRIGSWTPADAVFLTMDNDQAQPIIIAAGGMGVRWPGVIPALKDPWAGWAAGFPLARIPQGRPVKLTVWALDIESARACRIDSITITP